MVWSPPKNSEYGLYPPLKTRDLPLSEDVFDTFPNIAIYGWQGITPFSVQRLLPGKMINSNLNFVQIEK